VSIPVAEHTVFGYRPQAMIMIECGFVFDVCGFGRNDYSSSAIDEEDAPVFRETSV
jgi:hypothetical protein